MRLLIKKSTPTLYIFFVQHCSPQLWNNYITVKEGFGQNCHQSPYGHHHKQGYNAPCHEFYTLSVIFIISSRKNKFENPPNKHKYC